MTPKDFEDYLVRIRFELNSSFKETDKVSDFDVYTKLILDHQEIIAKALFNELDNINSNISRLRTDLLRDNREKFTTIMDKLSE